MTFVSDAIVMSTGLFELSVMIIGVALSAGSFVQTVFLGDTTLKKVVALGATTAMLTVLCVGAAVYLYNKEREIQKTESTISQLLTKNKKLTLEDLYGEIEYRDASAITQAINRMRKAGVVNSESREVNVDNSSVSVRIYSLP